MRQHFTRTLEIAAPAAVLWAFHEHPDAFARLSPPWEHTEVVLAPTSLEVGTRVVARTRVGPVTVEIEALHVAYERGRMFTDRLVRGPFRFWEHRHTVESTATGSRLIDAIEYELPLGALGNLVAGRMVARRLEKLFEYRHRVTREHCEARHSAR